MSGFSSSRAAASREQRRQLRSRAEALGKRLGRESGSRAHGACADPPRVARQLRMVVDSSGRVRDSLEELTAESGALLLVRLNRGGKLLTGGLEVPKRTR